MTRRRGGVVRRAVIVFVCSAASESVDRTIDAVTFEGIHVVVLKMAIPGAVWLIYFREVEGNSFGAVHEYPAATERALTE